ncbi:MAG: DUF6273 domain-containing protein, partial [bacterium]|nr:DUF6273 domain-containing protein [bacterium]
INAQNHWVINGVDSGIAATGAQGPKGEQGDAGNDGVSVVSIVKTNTEGLVDTYTITYSNNTTSTFTVTNGAQGQQGIQGEPGENGVTPTISINAQNHWVINGVDSGIAATGAQGPKGEQGLPGKDGVSIISILKTSSEGLVDTYTIYYSNETTSTFTITNGAKGDKGEQGEMGPAGPKGDDATTYIPCKFLSYTGGVLYEFFFAKGTDAVYQGPVPYKPPVDFGNYTEYFEFAYWDHSLKNITEPTIFKPVFNIRDYKIKFYNYDGTLLYETTAKKGEDVEYKGNIPTKESDGDLNFEFSCWDKPLTNISNDMIYVAQFSCANLFKKCTFINYDGSLLYETFVENGQNVKYLGDEPFKEGIITDKTKSGYVFTGWDKSTFNIKADTIFTAQFGAIDYYLCDFVDFNDEILSQEWVFEGGQADYTGVMPIREDSINGNLITEYTFFGWDKPLSNISSPTIFKAIYSENSYTGYKIIFKGKNNEILYEYYCEEGETAKFPYKDPFYYNETSSYNFISWDKDLSNVTSSFETSGIYYEIDINKIGKYPASKVTDENLIESIASKGKTNSKGYIEYNGNEYEYRSEYTKDCYYLVEPIQWTCLDSDENSALLISKYILDSGKFGSTNNYKDSDVREWLNNDFLMKAFEDTDFIVTRKIDNSVASTGYETNPFVCETTYDKVSLISAFEANTYFKNADERKCLSTDYSRGRDEYTTRSPAIHNNNLDNCSYLSVVIDGNVVVGTGGRNCYSDILGFRPCVQISLK